MVNDLADAGERVVMLVAFELLSVKVASVAPLIEAR
jgi:hypothetical protein